MSLWTPWSEMVGGGITPLILNFDVWWRSVVNCTFQLLYLRKERTSGVQYTGCWAGLFVLCNKDIARNRTPWSSSPLPNHYTHRAILGPITRYFSPKLKDFSTSIAFSLCRCVEGLTCAKRNESFKCVFLVPSKSQSWTAFRNTSSKL